MSEGTQNKNRSAIPSWALLSSLFFILFFISGTIGVFLNYTIQKRDFARGHSKLFEANAVRFFQEEAIFEEIDSTDAVNIRSFDFIIDNDYKSFALFEWSDAWVPIVITSPALAALEFNPTSLKADFYRYFGVYFWNGNTDAVLSKTPFMYSAFWRQGRLFLLAVEIEHTWLYEHLLFPRRAILLGLLGAIPKALLFAVLTVFLLNLLAKIISDRLLDAIKMGLSKPPFQLIPGFYKLAEFMMLNAKELEQQRREKRVALMEKNAEFERERGDFALVNDITKAAALAPDLRLAATAALERISRRLGVRCAAIFAADSTGQVVFVGDYELPADISHTLLKSEGLSNLSFYFNELGNGCAILPIKSLAGVELSPIRSLEGEGLTHCVIIPLFCRDKAWGIIHLYCAGRPRIPEREKTVLLTIANTLSVILENKRLLDDLDEKIKENINYYELSKMLISTTEFDILLENIIWLVHETIDVDHCSIMLTDEEGENLYVKALWGYSEGHKNQIMPLGEGVTGWVAENGQAVLIHDVSSDSRYRMNVEGVKSELAVPLIAEGKVIGVIDCESNVEYAFDETDLRFLNQLSGPASLAIKRTLLQTCMARQFILDPTTQAYNRSYFDDYVSKHGKELLLRHSCISLAIIRITNLREIEVEFGRTASDLVVLSAKQMLSELYPEALTARYSDSEFYVLLPGMGEEAMEKLVETVRTRSMDWANDHPGERPLSFTAGYATATRFDELESLFHRSSEENFNISPNP